MNFEQLFSELGRRRIRLALTGANGGFGRTFIAQCLRVPHVELAALCDRDIEGLHRTILAMGHPASGVRVCASREEARTGFAGILLVPDAGWLDEVPLDMVIEATGQPEASVAIAERALRRGVHVGMVTKETDSVAGPWLGRLAREHGVVCTAVEGDQPANLIGLWSWARVLGFEIVAAGKASEHDFIYDPRRGEVSHAGVVRRVEGLDTLWRLPDDPRPALEARRRALVQFPLAATPDYCEMCVVANGTGLAPASPALSYPLCRASELADVFIPAGDGGVLTRTGVVDVFNPLRRVDEASFAGGVFVVVRCADEGAWSLLAEKGHVVGRNRKYAALYAPYHLMGLESLTTVYSAVLHRRSSGTSNPQAHAVMAARARRHLPAGTVLEMGGHMHDIACAEPLLLPAADASAAAPYYLAANKRLTRPVEEGCIIPVSALDLDGSALHQAWLRMREEPSRQA